MEEMIISTYAEFKNCMDAEINKVAGGFVKIGYLLKQARDTDILRESGYENVNEFAEKEYGLDKSQVSRFIRINDRFAIDGNSEELLPQYEGFGVAKLGMMLSLPEEITEELSPGYTKEDIQTVKEEYEEEQKITDLEILMEEKKTDEEKNFLENIVKELLEEFPDPMMEFYRWQQDHAEEDSDEVKTAALKEIYAPEGDRSFNIRISGWGRFLVSMHTKGNVSVVNMRSGEKLEITWDQFFAVFIEEYATHDIKIPEKETTKTASDAKQKAKKRVKKSKKAAGPDTKCKEEEKPETEPEEADTEEGLERIEGEEMPPEKAPSVVEEPIPEEKLDAEEEIPDSERMSQSERMDEITGELTDISYMSRDAIHNAPNINPYHKDELLEQIKKIREKTERLYQLVEGLEE